MDYPTARQQNILDFLQAERLAARSPSRREIAQHCGLSLATVNGHIQLMLTKGLLKRVPGKARSLQVVAAEQSPRTDIRNVPILGSIPAGLAESKMQEHEGRISIDVETLGFIPTQQTFAVRVYGDSMIGRQIAPGDTAIVEGGVHPRSGDIVVALIDNESTLKTYLVERGRPFLKAENPRYPDLIPVDELIIQGVVRFLCRRVMSNW